MTKHPGTAHTGEEPGAPARNATATRADRGVSERIYEYILSGRSDQPLPGARRAQPPTPS